MKEKGHTVNETCGIHVHVGFADKSATDLAKLITIVSYLERGLYAITGTKSRERDKWCESVKYYDSAKNYQDKLRFCTTARYKILNIKNLQSGGTGTVEFRCFSGSLDAKKIVGWVQVCLGIVEKALTCKRCPSWNGKKLEGIWKRDGVGQTETERLLAYLCWGNYGKYLTHMKAYGWISNDIKQESIKKTFRELAKKYDDQE